MYTTWCLMVIHPYAKIWYAYFKEQRHFARLKLMVKIYNFSLRSIVKVRKSPRMYATHRTMVIHSLAKQSITMSKDKKAGNWTQSHVINPINLTSRSMLKVVNVSGSWMYLTHPLMAIDPCAKYGLQMSKLTEVKGLTCRHDKSL